MRVCVATVTSPGIFGGAEIHAHGLAEALRRAGHLVQTLEMPFHYQPPAAIADALRKWQTMDFTPYDGGQIDRMICMKFPAYCLDHPNKVVWLLHQHRPVYDLWDTPFGASPGEPENGALRDEIVKADKAALGDGTPLFTISNRISERLRQSIGIEAPVLYHPPARAERFYCMPPQPYIFFPSRIESLKRQELLVRAIAKCDAPVTAVLSGNGGQAGYIARLIEDLNVGDRVRMLGYIHYEDPELLALYANALGVFFGPLDEDYGYITLEGMLSSKPVITCTDSGGPREFVRDGETGFVVAPEPEPVAAAITKLWEDKRRAVEMGQNGRALYGSMGISWENVVDVLLSAERRDAAA